MTKFRTHYDNLQVARSASPEVIAAAYRSLSRKYHPDVNSGDPDGERRMKIINASYAVLSDPQSRKRHDDWIKKKEVELTAKAQPEVRYMHTPHSNFQDMDTGFYHRKPEPAREYPEPNSDDPVWGRDNYGSRSWGREDGVGGPLLKLIAAGVFMLFLVTYASNKTAPKSGLPAYDRADTGRATAEASAADPSAGSEDYVPSDEPTTNAASRTFEAPGPDATSPRVLQAPNGSPWPKSAGYVDNYPRQNTGGRSAVSVDNSANDSAVYVKLVSIEKSRTRPTRHIYIPAGSSFTMKGVTAGEYDVRYMDIEDGSLARTDPFELTQTSTEEGISFNSVRLTLYRVANGNMQMHPLSPEEF